MLQIVLSYVMGAVHLQPAACRMDIASVGVGLDSGEEPANNIVTAQMMSLVESRMDTVSRDVRLDTGEKGVMNNVTIQMEPRVIRLMDHVCPVSLNKKVYFLFSFKNNWTILFSMHCGQKCILK